MLVTLRTVKTACIIKARLADEEKKKNMGVDFGVGISCKAACLKEKKRKVKSTIFLIIKVVHSCCEVICLLD